MALRSNHEPLRIVLAAWAPFVGGAEVAVERLAVGLRDAGHDVRLIVGTRGDALARFEAAGLRCEYIEQRFTSKLGWLKFRQSRNRVMHSLIEDRPDIVHSNDLPTHQLISQAAQRLGLPRVCHHRWIFEQKAIDWLNKYGAEQHLFVSDALMQMLCSESAKLQASERQVVYDGLPIPDQPTAEERAAAKQELGLDANRVTVLFAGQIIERKGVADTLHAWHALPLPVRDRAELVIVGDDLEHAGAYRVEMEKLAAQLGHPVRFAGFQRNVPRWLTAADVVLVPSHAEPLGNATLEAMAHGRPVVGTNVGGIPEMVRPHETGLIVAPKHPSELAAAISQLIASAAIREQLGAEARRQCIARFSLAIHVKNVVTCYRQLLERHQALLHPPRKRSIGS